MIKKKTQGDTLKDHKQNLQKQETSIHLQSSSLLKAGLSDKFGTIPIKVAPFTPDQQNDKNITGRNEIFIQ